MLDSYGGSAVELKYWMAFEWNRGNRFVLWLVSKPGFRIGRHIGRLYSLRRWQTTQQRTNIFSQQCRNRRSPVNRAVLSILSDTVCRRCLIGRNCVWTPPDSWYPVHCTRPIWYIVAHEQHRHDTRIIKDEPDDETVCKSMAPPWGLSTPRAPKD